MARHRRPAHGVHQAAWSVAGALSLGLMQWIVVAVLARHGGPTLVGAYALALAIAAPVFTLSMLQLRALLITAANPVLVRGRYLATRLCTSALALVLVVGCAALVGGTTALFLVAIGLARFCETIGDIFLGCLQSAGHVDLVGRNQALLALSTTVLFAVALVVSGELIDAIWVMSACSLVVGLVLPWRQVRASLRRSERLLARADFATGSLLAVVRSGLPLGGSSSVGALGAAAPRFVLEHSHGSAAVGVYSGVIQLSQALTAVAGAVAQAQLPALVRRFHGTDGAAHLSRSVLTSVSVCTAGGLALAVPAYVWGPDLVQLLYGDDFVVGRSVVAMLALATGVLSSAWFLDQAMVAQRRTRTQLMVNLLGLAVVAGGCSLLASRHGLFGVATAVTASAVVQCLTKTCLVLKAGRRVKVLATAS